MTHNQIKEILARHKDPADKVNALLACGVSVKRYCQFAKRDAVEFFLFLTAGAAIWSLLFLPAVRWIFRP